MSTQNSGQNIDNATEIIERFGGIRPMAKKIGVAVTTIQGWKKRDSIPANRRGHLLKMAGLHDVDLSDLVQGAPPVAGASAETAGAGENTTAQRGDTETQRAAATQDTHTQDKQQDTQDVGAQDIDGQDARTSAPTSHSQSSAPSGSETRPQSGSQSGDAPLSARPDAPREAASSQSSSSAPSAPSQQRAAASSHRQERTQQGGNGQEGRQGNRPRNTGSRQDQARRRNAAMLNEMNKAQSIMSGKTMVAWSVGLVIVLAIVAALLFWPVQNETKQNARRIADLDNQVNAVKEKQSLFQSLVPEDLKTRVDNVKKTAQDLQNQVQTIKTQTNELRETASILMDSEAGSLTDRLAMLESRLETMSQGTDMELVMGRIDALQTNFAGQQKLQDTVDELAVLFANTKGQSGQMAGQMDSQQAQSAIASMMGGDPQQSSAVTNGAADTAAATDAPETVEEALAEAQEGDGALSETLHGVSKTDLKAAAYLIGLSKFRQTTRRSKTPLTEDLDLIYRMVDEDDTELRAAIERLAPQAERGVLTPDGLSGQFKGLAGDIVVSSLKGEDISLKDRANARLHDVLKVEKDGEMLTGTDTQVTVERAQAYLDEGNIEAALAELKTLDGAAAEEAAPFMEEAEMTLAAQQVQALLGDKILSHFGGGLPGGALSGNGGASTAPVSADFSTEDLPFQTVDGLIGTVQRGTSMQNKVLRDDESGVSILPRGQNLPVDLKSMLPGSMGGSQPIRLPTATDPAYQNQNQTAPQQTQPQTQQQPSGDNTMSVTPATPATPTQDSAQ